MSAMNNNKETFKNSLMGYHKAEVDDYIARLESELEIKENRQGKLESQIKDLNDEIERLKTVIANEREERVQQQDKNRELNRTIAKVSNVVDKLKQEKEEAEKRIKELQDPAKKDETVDPKIIQDAILSAQKMSEMIIAEANQKAEGVKTETELYHQEQERIARKIVEDAEKESNDMIEKATAKCESLQRNYNSTLLEVAEFKTQLLKMYQNHIKLLERLPEIQTPQRDCLHVVDMADGQENEKSE